MRPERGEQSRSICEAEDAPREHAEARLGSGSLQCEASGSGQVAKWVGRETADKQTGHAEVTSGGCLASASADPLILASPQSGEKTQPHISATDTPTV